MPKAKNKYPEIEDIKEDLESLKDNVVELTKHIKDDGLNKVEKVEDIASTKMAEMKLRGQYQMKKVEKQIKEKPAQSVAIAFAGGLLASALLRGRR